jgi:hypothetical protein
MYNNWYVNHVFELWKKNVYMMHLNNGKGTTMNDHQSTHKKDGQWESNQDFPISSIFIKV